MSAEGLAKPLWGCFEGCDMDSSWLDRLDVGLDFHDILVEGPADGLVPTLDSPMMAALVAADFAGFVDDALQVPCFEPLPLPAAASAGAADIANDAWLYSGAAQAAGHDGDAAATFALVPQPPLRTPTAAPEPPEAPAAPSPLRQPPPPAVVGAGRAAAPPPPPPCQRAGLSFPNVDGLTRQQRVARYRDKRARRRFAKVVRYASRQAYAEVRPRIKGRFAKREEVAAWRAAEAAMRGAHTETAAADGNDMVVPVM